MDINEYYQLFKLKNKAKRGFAEDTSEKFQQLIAKFEKLLIKNLNSTFPSNLSFSSFSDVIEAYFDELNRLTNNKMSYARTDLISINNSIKEALDFIYPIDYQLLPKANFDSLPTLLEMQGVIDRYRKNQITEQRTKRIIAQRLRKPAHVASTYLNTQLSGFDNQSIKTIADLSGLKKAVYFGPYRHGHTREFCEKLLLNRQPLTENQIRGLDNKQGLPVLKYCGGYNCMHEWMWIGDDWKIPSLP